MPKTNRADETEIICRAFAADYSTLNDAARSIDGVAATEQPILAPDLVRKEMIPEVLLMSGAQFPESVPLLDAHKRSSTEDVLGSAINLRVQGDQLLCTAVFDTDDRAERAFQKVKKKHIKDLSVGATPLRKQYVPAGKTVRISGRSFTGPMNVVTSWIVREVSLTPVGADSLAKLRGLSGNPFQERGSSMLTKELRDKLVARGMPADLDDAAAVEWAVNNPETKTVEKVVEKEVVRGGDTREIFDLWSKQQAEKEESKRKLHSFIRTECKRAHVDPAEILENAVDEQQAGRLILDAIAKRDEGGLHPAIGRMEYGPERNEKFGDVLRTAVLMRSLGTLRTEQDTQLSSDFIKRFVPNPAQGWEDYRYASLFDIARECLSVEQVNLRGLAPYQIAELALDLPTSGIRRDSGFHFSASFPNLLLDAMNKTLLAGYLEKEHSYVRVFRQAQSVKDFKNIHRVRLSEIQNLNLWPDNQKPEEWQMTDERETYAVEAYANEISLSWRLIVNDDLDALSRIPQLAGRAARRTLNAVCWAPVLANQVLQDGVALYSDVTGNRKSDNTTTGAVTVANLGAARALMRRMKGVNTKGGNASAAILNIEPKFLVVPATIETVADQVLNSVYDPTANTFQVKNPFRSNMELVVEPLLDETSTAQWYVFSDPGDCDHIEYTFLQGQETPVTNDWIDNHTRARIYQIVQTFAAKAIDFRGTVRSTGS